MRPDDLVEITVSPAVEHLFASMYVVSLHLQSVKLLQRFVTVVSVRYMRFGTSLMLP